MVQTYKVIKAFGCARVNDIFEHDSEFDVYVMSDEVNDEAFDSIRSMCITAELAKDYANNGFLEEDSVVEIESADNAEAEKYKKVIDTLTKEITKLENKYKQRNEAVIKKYEAGKMPTCQKVEHDTVHFNLTKLLNRFKDILNGNE